MCQASNLPDDHVSDEDIYDVTGIHKFLDDDSMNASTASDYISNKIPKLRSRVQDLQMQYMNDPGGAIGAIPSVLDELEGLLAANEDLRKSEERYRGLIEAARDVIALLSIDGNISSLNPAFEVITGWSCAEPIGKHFAQLIHPEDIANAVKNFNFALRGEHSIFEARFVTKDGKYVPVEVMDAPQCRDGKVTGILSIIRDITDRRRSEEQTLSQRDLAIALVEAESLKDALKACLNTALKVSGMDCGGIYLVDKSGDLRLAYGDGLSSDFLDKSSHYWAGSDRWCKAMSGAPLYSSYDCIGIKIPADKQLEGLRALAVMPIIHRGVIIGCFNIASHSLDAVPDFSRKALEAITAQVGNAIARLQVEEALLRSQVELQDTFDSIQDFLFILDSDGRILRSNKAVVKRLGYSEDELKDMNVLDIHPPECRSLAGEIVADMIAGMRDFCPIPLMAKDGTRISVETKVSLERWSCGDVIIGISRDISERLKMEDALRKSIARYRAVVEDQTELICRFTLDGKLSFVNDAYCRYFDKSREELIGKSFVPLIPEEDQALIGQKLSTISANNPAVTYEHRVTTPKGICWMEWTDRAILNEQDSISEFQSVGRDITERRTMENALRDSEELFHTLVDNMLDSAIITDWNGNVLFANRSAASLVGLNHPLKNEVNVLSLVDPGHVEVMIRDFARVKEGCGGFLKEYKIRTIDGIEKWVECLGTNIGFRGQTADLVTLRDVTDRKHAEEALQKSEELFRLFMDNSPTIAWMKDEEGHYVYLNKGIEDRFNIKFEEWLGKTDLELRAMEDAEICRKNDLTVLSSEMPLRAITEISSPEGMRTSWLNTIFPFQDAYGNRYAAGIGLDVTDQRRMEVELRRAKDELELRVLERTRDLAKANEDLLAEIAERKIIEERLTKSEDQLRKITENMLDMVGSADKDGHYTYLTPSHRDVLGYEIEELLGQHIIDQIHPDDLERVSAAYETAFRTKLPGIIEYRCRHKDGHYIWLETVGKVLLDDAGQISSLILSTRDITKRKQAEKKLKASESKYRNLYESMMDAFVYVGVDGRIIEFNDVYRLMLGYEPDELRNLTYIDITPEKWHDFEANLILNQAYARGYTDIYEKEYRRKDGTTLPIELRAYLIRDEQGKPSGLWGIVRDITNRKRAEEDMAKHNALLKSIIESPRNIISFSLDRDYRYISFNELHSKTMKAIWGTDISMGMNMMDVIGYTDDKEKAKANFNRALSGENFTIAEQYGDEALSRRYWDDIYNPIMSDQGEILGVTVFCIDVTEQKRAEEKMLKSLQEKEVLLREIHHRVKNNLQIASSLMSIQSKRAPDSATRDMFIEGQNRIRTISLMHNRLTKSNDLATIQFKDYVRDIVAQFYQFYNLRSLGISIKMDLDDTTLNMETAVPCGLIINELISNCIKHAFPDGRKGEIGIELHSNGDRIRLSVWDDGIGLGDVKFNWQTMGLQLVNSLVRQINGSLSIKSERGTRFEIDFSELRYKERLALVKSV